MFTNNSYISSISLDTTGCPVYHFYAHNNYGLPINHSWPKDEADRKEDSRKQESTDVRRTLAAHNY